MIPQYLREPLEDFLYQFPGDKNLARECFEELVSLLDFLERRGKEAEERGDRLEMAWSLREIQQLICFTPLRIFLEQFTQAPSKFVRAAAKGEIADQRGAFFADPETGLMAEANLLTMFQDRSDRISLFSEKLEKILQKAQEAGLPIPRLRVQILEPEEEE